MDWHVGWLGEWRFIYLRSQCPDERRIHPRHQLHPDPHHPRWTRRLSDRTGPLPAGCPTGMPVGESGGDHPAPAGSGERHLSRDVRPNPRPSELDVRPRSGRRRPGAGLREAAAGIFRALPRYDRGITVPAIVDVSSKAVVTNDYRQMTLDFSTEWQEFHRRGAPDLYPEPLRSEMDEVMELVYQDVNNGVYRCGFAASQEAYDAAYDRLFDRLDWLTERLRGQRYLMGDTITEADVRLFTTLARFDTVYHNHFKCNRNKLSELPVLWAYARDMFQTPGFGDTTDFVQIKQHYYVVHTEINPTRIVPKGPELSGWVTPHGREQLGGRPFGYGTPPGPVLEDESVPTGNGVPLAA